MKIWKRNAVVATIVLFVCVALYLSWQYGKTPSDDAEVFDPAIEVSPAGLGDLDPGAINDGDSNDAAAGNDYFDQARLTRKKARDAALAILTDAAGRETASQEARDNASAEINALAQNSMIEATIENLIIAKGFAKCVVFINQEGISIVVSEPEGGMTAADAAKIKDIVLSESSLTVDNIHLTHVPV